VNDVIRTATGYPSILDKFCGTLGTYKNQWFTRPLKIGPYWYALDGHICIRVPCKHIGPDSPFSGELNPARLIRWRTPGKWLPAKASAFRWLETNSDHVYAAVSVGRVWIKVRYWDMVKNLPGLQLRPKKHCVWFRWRDGQGIIMGLEAKR
jgi:hypothetical protein